MIFTNLSGPREYAASYRLAEGLASRADGHATTLDTVKRAALGYAEFLRVFLVFCGVKLNAFSWYGDCVYLVPNQKR